MELFIAGGVKEHGRNCFLVQEKNRCFLVDCGLMADTPNDPYPRLTPDQIRRLDAVFLTHSHADHTGALPWLYQNGFCKPVIATEETLHQIPFALPDTFPLETCCPGGTGHFHNLTIAWGRSGHCAGSVWFHFSVNGKTILFSGDYTEDTLIYAVDPIRNQTADIAVLDCAYGSDKTPYAQACDKLLQETEKLLSMYGLLLFPVPKYGRGLEIFNLLSDNPVEQVNPHYYADELFLRNLSLQRAGGFLYRPALINTPVSPYCGQRQGIVFVSDPQLRSDAAQDIAKQVLSYGGRAVMTGTVEKASYSESLLQQGKMELLRYPVHLNYSQFQRLAGKNNFAKTIPYHCAEY